MAVTINGTTGIAGVDGSASTPAVQGTDTNTGIFFPAADTIAFGEGGAEAMRIDSNSRLLVGTSTSVAVDVINSKAQIEHTNYDASLTVKRNSNGDGGPLHIFVKSRGTSNGSNTVVQSGDTLGQLRFFGTDGTDPAEGASIIAQVDGTPGNNDMPGRLIFSTTADGSDSPTERARISSGGEFLVGKTSDTGNTAGITLGGLGYIRAVRSGELGLLINRLSSDGTLVSFEQDTVAEGSISVSGTTVSYNGGHLSRWAQTQGPKDETLVKGTVLSNLDEMNVYVAPTTYWTEEDELPEGVNVGDVKVETHTVDNEQLNKVKVSDVEGDVNVAGVFVNWSHDEAHNVDEINMAMTGDMIIRIAQGVVVQKGDLLMSAGDGTAKPQGDDIVRSKTIAKVTSNHVTCTYADGSYCVPCVLMAC